MIRNSRYRSPCQHSRSRATLTLYHSSRGDRSEHERDSPMYEVMLRFLKLLAVVEEVCCQHGKKRERWSGPKVWKGVHYGVSRKVRVWE